MSPVHTPDKFFDSGYDYNLREAVRTGFNGQDEFGRGGSAVVLPTFTVSGGPNKALNDCYKAAKSAHATNSTRLSQIGEGRIESFFGSLAGQRSAAKAAFGEAVSRTVFEGAMSVGIGAAVGAGASWQWARAANTGRTMYATARSLSQINTIAAEVAALQSTANIVGGVAGTTAALGYNIFGANDATGAALGVTGELTDFVAGNKFSQTGILMGLTQATLEYISESGLSNAQAAGVVANIRGSVSHTQNALNGQLQSALSECDRKFK